MVENRSRLARIRDSPVCSVFIVFVAMFLDGALLTTVVPIIPEMIKEIKLSNLVKYNSIIITRLC